ncbi:MAG: SDR family oxidoreductase [Planctomycetes bacterium]|nr:SDR family oxidoreductase [Planctomycetota bacterium]
MITGGAVRVGRAIVCAFADRGYAVAIHANRSVEQANALAAELSERGVSTLVVPAELREETAVREMVDKVHAHFGRLDVLVNSAAIWSPRPLEEVTADEVRNNFEINSLATFVACQQAGLKMARQSTGGAIINIGDWSVARPYVDYAAYFPSKGTIPAMTRMFAVELSRRNPRVRVNAILPGPVIFPPDLPEAARRQAIASTLVQRAGTPENVAHAAVFLVENDFVTGVCLPVDGGRTISS